MVSLKVCLIARVWVWIPLSFYCVKEVRKRVPKPSNWFRTIRLSRSWSLQLLQLFSLLLNFIFDVFCCGINLIFLQTKQAIWGGSPGLVVMGGDSCSEGHEFKSQHHILDGHLFVVRVVMFVWKGKNKRKRGRRWPFSFRQAIFCLQRWLSLSVSFFLSLSSTNESTKVNKIWNLKI